MRIQVRCCCDVRLLGFLYVKQEPVLGQTYVYQKLMNLTPYPGASLTDRPPPPAECVKTLELQYERFMQDGEWKYAFKSKDYPMEELRMIPDFVEATVMEKLADESLTFKGSTFK